MVLALGLNVVPGFTGLLDLGYVGFFGIGAYTAGLLTVYYQWSLWLVLPLAALNGAVWGILRGAPTLRLSDDYFAIVTFGFSELIILVIKNELWLTRGPMGVPGIARPDFFGIVLNQPWQTYYLIFFFLLLVLWTVVRIRSSRLGRAWFAIREDEIAAECVGVNVARYKIIAFALSAAIGALAGAFYARWFRFIHPDMFKFWESILILCLIVFGGMGSITGALVGALVLIPLTEILRIVLPSEFSSARYLIFGLLIVVMMRWRPAGLLPLEKD
jgi:branched-chain amino acid transport system permease protein